MLEQWHADRLLGVRKVYSYSSTIDLSPNVDLDYQLEDADGNDFFLLDVWRPRLNSRKLRLQLRYRRSIVLARLYTAVDHTNPDGEALQGPHLHRYREGYEDKWAEPMAPFDDLVGALGYFCTVVNLSMPDIQGGFAR
jgi:hypothetical protein